MSRAYYKYAYCCCWCCLKYEKYRNMLVILLITITTYHSHWMQMYIIHIWCSSLSVPIAVKVRTIFQNKTNTSTKWRKLLTTTMQSSSDSLSTIIDVCWQTKGLRSIPIFFFFLMTLIKVDTSSLRIYPTDDQEHER